MAAAFAVPKKETSVRTGENPIADKARGYAVYLG